MNIWGYIQRNWVSVLLMASVAGVICTGMIGFSTPYSELNMGIHVVFALLFLIALGLHLRFNFGSLKGYLMRKPLPMFSLVLGVVVVACLSVLLQLPPLYAFVELGQTLRSQAEVATDEMQIIKTEPSIGGNVLQGRQLELLFFPGEGYVSEPIKVFPGLSFRTVPQIAVWLEDQQGNYLTTLYATGKASNAGWQTLSFSSEEIARPEALPRWAHQRNVMNASGMLMPTATQPLLDAITAATPLSSHLIVSRLPANYSSVRVMLEINRSFDFNEYWHPDAFPDDEVYSGPGNSGQPALVYQAVLDLTDAVPGTAGVSQQYVPFELIGHSHRSGKNGEIYTDLSGFTTARKMLDWALIKVLPIHQQR
ncbi:MAG: hypothetical protein ACR2PW_03895 [Gammaproteobacteria bacterium]